MVNWLKHLILILGNRCSILLSYGVANGSIPLGTRKAKMQGGYPGRVPVMTQTKMREATAPMTT